MGTISSSIEDGTSKLTIEDIEVGGKRVFLRVDFNVPLDEQRNITDDTRIRSALPTINYLLDEGAKVVIAAHLGRPKKGKPDPKYSLAPVAKRLSRLVEKECPLVPDCVGPEVKGMVDGMKPGSLLLLENLRFHEGEEKIVKSSPGNLPRWPIFT